MSTTKWHEGPMVALDFESTGVNPHEERAVTAAIVHRTPGERPRTIQWLIDPGCDVPEEAAAVHGWTTDRLRTRLNGREALRITTGRETPLSRDGALHEIAAQVATAIGTGTPLVVCNAAYDCTLLDASLTREGIDTIASRPKGWTGVVDPMVIEKQYDPYRRVRGGCKGGKHACGGCGMEDKRLGSLCAHYGVRLTGAHDASADALAGIRLAVRLAGLWPEIARLRLDTLFRKQIEWKRDQMLSLRSYFDRQGIEHDGCCPEFPLHLTCRPERAVV